MSTVVGEVVAKTADKKAADAALFSRLRAGAVRARSDAAEGDVPILGVASILGAVIARTAGATTKGTVGVSAAPVHDTTVFIKVGTRAGDGGSSSTGVIKELLNAVGGESCAL